MKVFVMKDDHYPIYELARVKGRSVFEKELDIPQEDWAKYIEIDNKYWAMQSLIEELYDKEQSN